MLLIDVFIYVLYINETLIELLFSSVIELFVGKANLHSYYPKNEQLVVCIKKMDTLNQHGHISKRSLFIGFYFLLQKTDKVFFFLISYEFKTIHLILPQFVLDFSKNSFKISFSAKIGNHCLIFTLMSAQ